MILYYIVFDYIILSYITLYYRPGREVERLATTFDISGQDAA